MDPKLPTDEDTNRFFDQVVQHLEDTGQYSFNEATQLVQTYYKTFRDPDYCASVGIPVQDDDFFHHEGSPEIARRIHYCLTLKGDPKHMKYVAWRSSL